MVIKYQEKPSIHTPAITLQKNFEETKATPSEKPRTMQTKDNKHTEPHIVQQNKQQQETF